MHRVPMKKEKRQKERERRKNCTNLWVQFKVTTPKLDADIGLGKRVRPLLWGLLGNNNLKTTKICYTNTPMSPI